MGFQTENAKSKNYGPQKCEIYSDSTAEKNEFMELFS